MIVIIMGQPCKIRCQVFSRSFLSYNDISALKQFHNGWNIDLVLIQGIEDILVVSPVSHCQLAIGLHANQCEICGVGEECAYESGDAGTVSFLEEGEGLWIC